MKKSNYFKKASMFLAMFVCVMVTQAQVHPLYHQAEQITSGPGIAATNTVLVDFESGRGQQIGGADGWGVQSAGRGEIVSLQMASRTGGHPVRFGEYALRVNFDLTAAQQMQTLGIYFNPNGAEPLFTIPAGTGDRRFGYWIYVTPEFQQAHFWMRPTFAGNASGSPSAAPANVSIFGASSEPTSSSLRLGWQYIDVIINSSTNTNRHNQLRPFSAATVSWSLFRFMQVSNGQVGQRPLVRGHFYIDNLRFNIGAEDRAQPVITAVTGNSANLRTPQTFTQSEVTLRFNYNDPAANTSHINTESAIMAVNGVIYTHGSPGFTADASSATLTRTFRNGTHTVQVYIEDNFGHITHETVTFTVNDPNFVATNIWLEPADAAFVGGEFLMDIVTDKTEDVQELNLNFEWPGLASVAPTGALEFAPGVTGSYTYSAGRLNVILENNTAAATGARTLATISVSVSDRVFEEEILRIIPGLATATFADGEREPFSFFEEFAREIHQELRFSLVRFIIGQPGQVLVTDLADGMPLAGATVRVGAATSITDANGIAATSVPTGMSDISATKDGRYSFTVTSRALDPHHTRQPVGIRSGTNVDNATEKTFAWLSVVHPTPAIVRVAKEADGEGAFVEHIGETRYLNFAASRQVIRGNRVHITGLEPGTWYIYQVGDGEYWSETQRFRTTYATDRFSFVALGDYQFSGVDVNDLGMLLAAGNTIAEMDPPPFFHMNVADNNDTDDNYNAHFAGMTHVYNERPAFRALNLHAAYGNHEYQGYSGNIKFLNAHPLMHPTQPNPHFNYRMVGDGTFYSIYGDNMIIFSLDWELRGGVHQMEMARWMDYILTYRYPDRFDWIFATLHYPLYPNPSTPSSHASLNWVFNKHNFNIVFCGHGHSFRRDIVNHDGIIVDQRNNAANWTNVYNSEGMVIHWQLGGLRIRDGQNQNWTVAEVDGRRINFIVRDGNNNVHANRSWVLYHQDYGHLTLNFHVECSDANGTISAAIHGEPVADGETIHRGREVVFTAHPNSGYKVSAWRVNGDIIPATRTTEIGNTLTMAFEENATVTVEFAEDGTVGRDEVVFADLQILPNPFTNAVQITGAENSTLQILDVLGATVHTQEIVNETETIQLSQLSEGVYFFRVERDGQSKTVRVIKR